MIWRFKKRSSRGEIKAAKVRRSGGMLKKEAMAQTLCEKNNVVQKERLSISHVS
jgi:hypothetical protein